MRWLVAAMATTLAVPAWAEDFTCEQFKARLAEAIHADGDAVALPGGYRLAFQEEGNPHLRYEYGGIVGLKGDLNCVAEDRFQSFDATADLEGITEEEGTLRLKRLLALSRAAICTTERLSLPACTIFVRKAFDKVMKGFTAERERGEQHPGGQDDENISTATELEMSIVRGGAYVSIHSNLHRKAEDLE